MNLYVHNFPINELTQDLIWWQYVERKKDGNEVEWQRDRERVWFKSQLCRLVTNEDEINMEMNQFDKNNICDKFT